MNRALYALALPALALAGYAAHRLLTGPAPAPAVSSVSVGGKTLRLPSGYFRAESRFSGVARAQLAAFFPEFSPAGAASDIDGKTDLSARFARLVSISVEPATADVPPEERVAKLYLGLLEDGDWSQPGGLTARDFKSDSPFAGDKLFFAPPDGREFAARCPRADAPRATPNTCAYDFRRDGVDVEVRFPAALISEWRTIRDGASALVAQALR